MPPPDTSEPTVEIIVQFSERVATVDTGARLSIEEKAGVTLEPMHPGTPDPQLAKFAITRVAQSSAPAVIDHLLRCAEVDAAYAKADDALP
ncbi:MAG: hypothetical protein ACRDQ7_27145 [Haloechinothrix sp.]